MKAFLEWSDVVRVTGLSRWTIRRLIKAGQFPPSVELSPRRVGWHKADVDRWLEDKNA